MKRIAAFFPRAGITCLLLLLLSSAVRAQNRVVTGRVLSQKDNSPLAAVTVQVKNGTEATQTDATGAYSISVPPGANVLTFSFVGYQDQEVTLGSSNQVNVSLTLGSASLSDVVVVGYGRQRKSDLTGSVGSVRAAQLQERPAASVNHLRRASRTEVKTELATGEPAGAIVAKRVHRAHEFER